MCNDREDGEGIKKEGEVVCGRSAVYKLQICSCVGWGW